ncbi:unnamed protein product [Malus baccata var. baccata]
MPHRTQDLTTNKKKAACASPVGSRQQHQATASVTSQLTTAHRRPPRSHHQPQSILRIKDNRMGCVGQCVGRPERMRRARWWRRTRELFSAALTTTTSMLSYARRHRCLRHLIFNLGFLYVMCTLVIHLLRLMLDPYARIVYDYMEGIEDIRKAKVQTMIPASTSFREDCACILRAIRIAALLGFCISKETVHSVKSLSYSILRLDKGRLLMEMNYMLAYGYAEASLIIMEIWTPRTTSSYPGTGLIINFPLAAYFVRHGFRRRDKRTNMLLGMISLILWLSTCSPFFLTWINLSRDKPCHSSLWVAILAFHNALSEQPRDPLVVAALSLAIHNGGDMLEAVSIAKRVTKVHAVGFHELLESQNLNPRALRDEVKNLAASLTRALNNMTDEQIVSQAMAGYPQAPDSDLVLIPWGLSLRVCRIFSCLTSGAERGFIPRQGSKIDYESLAQGALPEVRHIFAGVVFDTIYPLSLNRDNSQT